MRDRREISFIAAIACILAILGVAIYVSRPHIAKNDPLLDAAIRNANETKTYRERVHTEASVNGEIIKIDGFYVLDAVHGRYASYSTTTLMQANDKPQNSFSISNIAIGLDVYVRVQNLGTLTLSIPADGAWKHFRSDRIPEAYRSIATPGPLLDNLSLFAHGGEYLILLHSFGTDTATGEPLQHYQFALSAAGLSIDRGILAPIAKRIGDAGTIDVWVDAGAASIRRLRFQNGSYTSTTEINAINEAPEIDPPSFPGGDTL